MTSMAVGTTHLTCKCLRNDAINAKCYCKVCVAWFCACSIQPYLCCSCHMQNKPIVFLPCLQLLTFVVHNNYCTWYVCLQVAFRLSFGCESSVEIEIWMIWLATSLTNSLYSCSSNFWLVKTCDSCFGCHTILANKSFATAFPAVIICGRCTFVQRICSHFSKSDQLDTSFSLSPNDRNTDVGGIDCGAKASAS